MPKEMSPEQAVAEQFAFSTPGEPTTEEQYQAFFFAWEERIKVKISRYNYFDEDEIEDIFQELMVSWVAKDYISAYDASRGVNYGGVVYGFVEANIKRFIAKKKKANDRSAPIEELDNETYGYEVNEPSESLQLAIDHLGRLPKNGTQDLRWLFITLLKQVEATGRIKQSDIARSLGITDRAVGHQMTNLREKLVKSGLVTLDARGVPVWTA